MENGVFFYSDWEDIFNCFSYEEVSQLLSAILDYAFRDKKTEFTDRALKVAYIAITNTIEREGLNKIEGGVDHVSIF